MATTLRNPEAKFTFRYVGRQGDFYLLRAPTWRTRKRNALDAQQFEGEVFDFLFQNANGRWHIGSFKQVHGYQPMPHAFHTANALCLLVEKVADLIALEQAFPVVW